MLNLFLIFLLFILSLSFSQPVIHFGFTAVVAKEDVRSVELFLKYLSEKTGYKFVPVFTKSYDEMDYLLSRGMVDVAYICGAPYVENKDSANVELLVVPKYLGKPLYYSYVITRKEKNYSSIMDFRGKPYAFSDPKSNSGSVVPTFILMKNGYTPEDFFKPIVYTYSHSESVMAVYYGFVEGASVDSIVFDQMRKAMPEITSHIKVIERYGPFPITPIVVRRDLQSGVKDRVKYALLEMEREKEGEEVLSRFGLDGFTVVEDSFYDPIRQMISFIKSYRQIARKR